MTANDVNFGSVFQKFRFYDQDGDLLGKCRINPADPKLAIRCEEVGRYFEEKKALVPQSSAEIEKYNDEVEEKVCYLLGYNARQELFGLLPACCVLHDGDLYINKVMERIIDAVEPEAKKRAESMQAAIAKHTAKYK